MINRWYLTPSTGTGVDGDAFRPKYTDNSGIKGFSAVDVSEGAINDYYAAVIDQNPGVERWYICRLYGEYTALQEISAKADTVTLALVGGQVGPILNAHFPDLDVPEEQWAEKLKVG